MLHNEQRVLTVRPRPPFESADEAGPQNPEFWAPPGRTVELPARGTAFVREVRGPRGAPTVVLLHGWFASAGINWFRVFEPLGRHFRVVAPDLRGHGLGARPSARFRLVDCADDVAALLDRLGVASAIMVGYSMGGPVAQLVWKRHRAKVDGLVFCATGHSLLPRDEIRWPMATMMAAAAGTTRLGQFAAGLPRSLLRQLPDVGIRSPLPHLTLNRVPLSTMQRWTASEMRGHDWRMVFEAGDEIGRYNAREWIGEVDVPTAVLVTTRDLTVLPRQQIALVDAIPDATMHRFDDNHFGVTSAAFAKPLVAACVDVAGRAYPAFGDSDGRRLVRSPTNWLRRMPGKVASAVRTRRDGPRPTRTARRRGRSHHSES